MGVVSVIGIYVRLTSLHYSCQLYYDPCPERLGKASLFCNQQGKGRISIKFMFINSKQKSLFLHTRTSRCLLNKEVRLKVFSKAQTCKGKLNYSTNARLQMANASSYECQQYICCRAVAITVFVNEHFRGTYLTQTIHHQQGAECDSNPMENQKYQPEKPIHCWILKGNK